MKTFPTVDAYIASFPEEIRSRLTAIRSVIREAAPDAIEKIAYGMPAYHLHGVLLYFGGWKEHIAIYPTGSTFTQEVFPSRLAPYKKSKGTIQFPLGEKLPLDLIRDIVEYRVRENTLKKK